MELKNLAARLGITEYPEGADMAEKKQSDIYNIMAKILKNTERKKALNKENWQKLYI